MGVDGGVNTSSATYNGSSLAGSLVVPGAAGLRGAAALGGTRAGYVINHNRYLRIGPGVIGKSVGRTPFNYGPGRNIPMMRVGNGRPNNLNHLDLRVLGK